MWLSRLVLFAALQKWFGLYCLRQELCPDNPVLRRAEVVDSYMTAAVSSRLRYNVDSCNIVDRNTVRPVPEMTPIETRKKQWLFERFSTFNRQYLIR
jgi:hypothetical protein